jgi:hypothetical protein
MERNKMIGWLLTIDGKQKACQYDNQLTPAPILFIYYKVLGSEVQGSAQPLA